MVTDWQLTNIVFLESNETTLKALCRQGCRGFRRFPKKCKPPLENGVATPIFAETADPSLGAIALNTPAGGRLINTSTTPLWRWSLAFILVCGFAFLSNAVPLAQDADGHLGQGLANHGGAWVLIDQQDQPAPVKRAPITSHSDEGESSSPLADVLVAAPLLLLGLLLIWLRQYFRVQIHLIPSRANCSPCSPRAPPLSQASV